MVLVFGGVDVVLVDVFWRMGVYSCVWVFVIFGGIVVVRGWMNFVVCLNSIFEFCGVLL